jgi:hypothetical protein
MIGTHLPTKPLTDLTQEAVHLLIERIGAADTVRFLGQFGTGSGNYTEERRTMVEQTSLADILHALEHQRNATEEEQANF